jgi:hypothetical protein
VKHTRIIVTRYGGPDALQVIEEERPDRSRVKRACECSLQASRYPT